MSAHSSLQATANASTAEPGVDRERSFDLTGPLPARVVFLTHYIPLYQVRVLEEIARRVRHFHVLISTPIEPNRQFELDWGSLDVTVQKTWTFQRRWDHRVSKHPKDSALGGFSDPLYVHVPYDTQRQLRRFNPDVVMSLELGARSLGAIRYCRRSPRAKSVLCTYMSEHTEQNRGALRAKLRRYLVNQADALTYNGPSCKQYLESIGADPSKLHRLAYAADDRSVYRGAVCRKESTVRSRLLYVGQLSERKGVLPMLRQLADDCLENPRREIEIRLAGDGPLRDSIERFEVPQNLCVRLLGNLSPSELANEMALAGASIAPTLADEWLLVVNEALQAGLPMIGSKYAQATTTLIKDGVNGWQYDPCQTDRSHPESLSMALERYFELSDQSIADMRSNCRQSIGHCTPRWAASGAIEAISAVMHSRRDERKS
ncbi:glycosyltransferase family 4 protein [Roseiconus lacunae]|uniref:glycosyltransferase family 4 protein n=1 Tax=Roseiconus lacunae TaxID=2605694 RepID=UPI001F2D3E9A|nr:glycosyltransferase family 4 protein [Roseiconus lacunae]